MSKTSSQVKNRWNAKNYDQILINVPKGQKEVIKQHAQEHGESVNGFINKLIKQALES